MIIQYSDNNENRIEWQHRRGGEWKTAELDELIEAYERATEPGDLISRQAAIAYAISGRTREIDGEKWIRVSEVRESLQTMPSGEKTGRWIKHEDDWYGDFYECSVCGGAFTLIDGTPADNLYNYCPNCGADMRGGQDALN